ncbi:MAG: hypothetical protein MRY74_06900 [Neomegalonema sp.]|nr:hypothetical protein [Neomegalonema sp.]
MRSLVVAYSLSGNTKKVANVIAAGLNADSEEIRYRIQRGAFMNGLRIFWDIATGRAGDVEAAAKDPASYDLIVLGGPIWSWKPCGPVLGWLDANASRCRQLAFFCTMGGNGAERSFDMMAKRCGKTPVATLAATEREVREDAFGAKVDQFLLTLRSASDAQRF